MIKFKLTNFAESHDYYFNSPIHVLHYLHLLMSDTKRFKTIAVDKQTYNALRNLGHTGESFTEVIFRLTQSANKED